MTLQGIKTYSVAILTCIVAVLIGTGVLTGEEVNQTLGAGAELAEKLTSVVMLLWAMWMGANRSAQKKIENGNQGGNQKKK